MCRSKNDGGRRCNSGHVSPQVSQGTQAEDEARYIARAAYIDSHPGTAASLLTGEGFDRNAAAADAAVQRMLAERSGDSEQWEG